jgi:hypothetical protein
MSIQNRVFKKIADFNFFKINIIPKKVNILDFFKDRLTADEIKKLDKNKVVRIGNNDIVTTDNWSKLKDIFFSQRMETYNSSYTLNEKIKLELETLEKLPIIKTDYKILKERYQKYLTNVKPQPKEIDKPDEVKENRYLEIFKNDLGYSIFLGLHNIYKLKPKKQANYSFLFYALGKDYLVCSGSDFITFLSKLNIHIDKIDSRQSGTNNKRDLFNSIQDKFLKAQ